MANYRTPVQADPALLQEFTAGVDTWPYNQPENQDEQAALTSYLNQNAGYRHGEHLWSTDLNKTTMTGYVGSALVLKAGGRFMSHLESCISWGGWEISMSMRQFCILPSKKHRSARQSWHFWR